MANNLYRVYQFALPTDDNAGAGYQLALTLWEQQALDLAGGFTDLGERPGSWRGDGGAIYSEIMQWYEVATDVTTKNRLMREAVRLFPDQKAFYVSELGRAEIVQNSELQQIAAREAVSKSR
jgi:hypothetical protein